MKITALEVFHCDAGWRNYHFVKAQAEDGTVGWSEFDEGFGSPGVTTVIEALTPRVLGQEATEHERIYVELFGATRPAQGSVIAEGLGAIENALLDLKARILGVPCYELLGGKVRDRIRIYWSHCATWRIVICSSDQKSATRKRTPTVLSDNSTKVNRPLVEQSM